MLAGFGINSVNFRVIRYPTDPGPAPRRDQPGAGVRPGLGHVVRFKYTGSGHFASSADPGGQIGNCERHADAFTGGVRKAGKGDFDAMFGQGRFC